MQTKIIFAILILVGLINFIPVVGIASAERLTSLYQVGIDDNNMLILLRSRALLLGLIGSLIIYSAFNPGLQMLAMIIGLISMLGFIFLTLHTGDYNEALKRIMLVDVAASAMIMVALGLSFIGNSASG
jgi:hypothetical protein